MTKMLRMQIRLAVVMGLLAFNLNLSFAQAVKFDKGAKLKTAPALRELQDPPVNARVQARQSVDLQKTNSLQIENGYVIIDAVADAADGTALLNQLKQLGLIKGAVYGRMVSGYFPIDKIDQLENVKALHNVTPAYKPILNAGVVVTQGDRSLLTDAARQTYVVSGKGSKIGIISDSYGSDSAGVAAGIASGDLPADVQILGDVTGGTDEGRAMTEIVHDIAPGAKKAFHTANGGQANFANGILKLADAGCNIIVDDVRYLSEPMFQDGIIAQAVDQVASNNVSYFSSAGNYARQSYQAAFKNSGQSVIIEGVNYGIAHDFGAGDIRQSIRIPARGTTNLWLQWDNPFFSVSGAPGARTDIDILFFFNGTLFTTLSSLRDNVGGDPWEAIQASSTTGATIEIAIVKYSGPDPSIIKWVEYGSATPLEHITNSSTVYGHSNAAGSIAVGASAWYNTPQFNQNLTAPVINSFSSLGGTPVFITPTGVNTGFDESKIRLKPEVVGPDAVNTTFFGSDSRFDTDTYPNFSGTSAAAPHIAAVAALMQEASKHTLTRAMVLEKLIASTIDMNDPGTPGFDTGFDFRTGWGFVQAHQAVESSNPACVNDTEAPTVLAAGFVLELPASGTRTIEAADIDYGSYDNCGIASMTIDRATFTCANLGANLVTLTVTDLRGHVAKKTVTVQVVDRYAPTILAAGFVLDLPTSGTRTIEAADIDYGSTDNCGIASMTIDRATFTCADLGPQLVTITVTDSNGNSSSQTVTVMVVPGSSNCSGIIASIPTSAAKTGVTEKIDNSFKLEAYPNPTAERLTIRVNKLEPNATVNVYTTTGASILSQRLTSTEQTLNLSAAPAGIYLVRVYNGSVLSTKRIVKN